MIKQGTYELVFTRRLARLERVYLVKELEDALEGGALKDYGPYVKLAKISATGDYTLSAPVSSEWVWLMTQLKSILAIQFGVDLKPASPADQVHT